MIILQNKDLTVKLDPTNGYALAHLSESGRPNVLDTADDGRYVQQSFYGAPNGSTWRGHEWVFNPVQVGSADNTPSKILSASSSSRFAHTSKVQAVDWATSKLVQTFFSQRVLLVNKIVYVDYLMEHYDAEGPVRDQELPAVFVKKPYGRLITLGGEYAPTWNAEPPYGQYYDMPGGFAALVNSKNYGLAMKSSVATRLTTYAYPDEHPCAYVAPLGSFALKSGFRFQHTIAFTVGLLSASMKLLKV